MNIMVVDDSIQNVKAIATSIEWEKLGIAKVHTAYNISQAKEIIENNDIQIIICDIEMPQGSGLDLIEWVKINSPQTENILLTCHAEFEYAKRAIELGSFDYLVKPIPFKELENKISQLIAKIKASSKLKKHSEYWDNNQKQIEGFFWYELIAGKITGNCEEIETYAKKKNVSFNKDFKYLLVLLTKKRVISRLEEWNENSLSFALENIAKETILNEIPSSSMTVGEEEIIIIVPEIGDKETSLDNIGKSCVNYIIDCNKYLGCSITGYIGRYVNGDNLADEFSELQSLDKNNVSFVSKIIDLNSGTLNDSNEKEILLPNISEWSLMLYNGDSENAVKEVKKYIDELVKGERINRRVLNIFHQDILQMLYSFLEQKGIQAHQLFDDEKSEKLYINATNSIDDMIKWVIYVFNKAVSYVDEVTKSQTVIEKVKTYIKENYNKDITRDDIASYVFLNPDYLSRIFKKATGLSLTEYLTEQRIEKSMQLLSTTNIQISSISDEVGYNNMNYFSKIFKKITGTTPIEYRKKSQNRI
ncbi:response regulator transcription factor [Clostridium saccharoperbutylacetonicum]|uniref:response regulator transcription factor n=1 Tax=Clostridium saccharoperbutylacetonicum TaxID=36745 RepID=UPI000983FD0D|nr:response regulator [Clostridium saccharoperbutylacetonicum]AQR96756.1 HTH-type transcriptional activator Btr [Clostridium saccharoperbutylacetonicum]NSB32634.1 two-component system response regulator YesN [Clostridium saccharoperbutylacetonicum]